MSPALDFPQFFKTEALSCWTRPGSREGRGPGPPWHESRERSWRKIEAGTEGAWKQRLRDSEGPGHERSRGESQSLQFRLLEPFCLGPPVLEPDLHLGLRQLQLGGELSSLRYRQVLLLSELLLKRVELLGGEGSPRLPVWLVLPQRAAEGPGGRLEPQVCNGNC